MSLVAWYPLIANGNNQGLDGINLETIGTIPYSSGKIGNAATFTQNLSNYLRRPQIKINDNFSFACWFKLDSTESTVWQTLFFEGRDVGNDGWGFRINGNNKRIVFCCGNVSRTYGTDLPTGTWHHACMTINNSVWTAYIDGNQIDTGTVTTLPLLEQWGTYFYIGCLSNSYYPLMGQIQDVRVYSHPLSKKEVKELAKGLSLYLPLDWGGNPNMIKNSYTWMNKSVGTNNGTSSLSSFTKSVIEDNTAPCKWVLHIEAVNSGSSATGAYVGNYYSRTGQGIELTDLTEGETYTYSFWARLKSGTGSITFVIANIAEAQTIVSSTGFTPLTNEWRKHTVTFKWTNTSKLTCCFYTSFPANSTITYELCGIKLEKGSKATPYIPNVEEAAYIKNSYATKYLQDCSGYNKVVQSSGTIVIDGDNAPRGTGSYFTTNTKVYCDTGFPKNAPIPNWTISFWFKPDIGETFISWSDVFRVVVDTEAGTGTRFRLETQNSSGNNYRIYYNNPGQSSYGGTAITDITEKIWYHLAFTCDGTKVYQYVNGSQISNFTINSGWLVTAPTGTIQFGDYGIYASFADCRVYATCLSADDIKELYQVVMQIDKSGNIYCNELVEE